MKKLSFILGTLMLPVTCLAHVSEVHHYEPVLFTAVDQSGKEVVALRSFERDNTPDYLIVDPYSLETKIVPQSDVRKTSDMKNANELEKRMQKTPYLRALNKFTSPPWPLQNQGVTRAEFPQPGTAFLTVDLCPSTHTFDKDFFTRLIKDRPSSSPFPLAISVSGRWIIKHEDAFKWLIAQREAKNLDFVWTNHTFNHPYFRGVKNENNFLLAKGTNVQKEMIDNEKLLISRQEVPSLFIRFPGLISDRNVIETVKKLGLIPLGAEAWLAKGQQIRDGSVVLVHGNGNEPAGLRLLTDKVLRSRTWLPLTLTLREVPTKNAVTGTHS